MNKIEEISKRYDCPYVETSPKTGKINELWSNLVGEFSRFLI
jgi:hypothetical protein